MEDRPGMIDLHSHILPGLDDGAPDIEVSIEMARIAVADGVTHMACTPHVMPGKYPNTSATILPAVSSLQAMLDARGIGLKLLSGADVHVAWDLPDRLRDRTIPTLNGTRYFLLEPPHEILPPNLERLASRLIDAGFVPIITHPERLGWTKGHYQVIADLSAMGCPLQLTAESLLGGFGSSPKELAIRMLDDGIVSLFASDAHSATWRKPGLSVARRLVAERWGEDLAGELFLNRPAAIVANDPLPALSRREEEQAEGSRRPKRRGEGLLQKMLGFR